MNKPLANYYFYTYGSIDNKKPIRINLYQKQSINSARKNNQPLLYWETEICDQHQVFATNNLSSGFHDFLWKESVSELFLAHPEEKEKYLEFEMTPYGQWLAIAHIGIRIRKKGHEIPSPSYWPHISINTQNSLQFGMYLTYQNIKEVINRKGELLFQGALSFKEKKLFLAPPWKLPSQAPKDFHQPHKFTRIQLEL